MTAAGCTDAPNTRDTDNTDACGVAEACRADVVAAALARAPTADAEAARRRGKRRRPSRGCGESETAAATTTSPSPTPSPSPSGGPCDSDADNALRALAPRAAAEAGLKPTIAAASSQARFPAAIALARGFVTLGHIDDQAVLHDESRSPTKPIESVSSRFPFRMTVLMNPN